MTSEDTTKNDELSILEGVSEDPPLSITRQLVKLNSALLEISSTLKLQEIQDIVTKEFVNVFSARGCTLSHWDKGEDVLVVLSEYAGSDWVNVNAEDIYYLLENFPLTEDALKNNVTKQISVNQADIDPGEKKRLEKFKVSSLLLLPLASQENVYGLIEVYDREERVFDKNELLIARLFSQHVVVAMENARLFSEAQRGYAEQKALHESAMIISTSLDLNTILTKLAEQVCGLLDATSVYLSSFDSASKTSIVLAEYYGTDASEKERISDFGFVYDSSNDLPSIFEIMQTGNTGNIHIDDLDLAEADRAYLEKFGGQSVLEIPLKSGGEFNAYIEVWETRMKREFTKNEILLCETIASQAAIAIENARLLSDAQKGYAEQKALHESAMIISTSLDINTILTKLAEQVCELLGTTSVYLSSFDQSSKTSQVLAEYYGSEASEKERVSDLGVVYDHTSQFTEIIKIMGSGKPMVYHHDDPNLAAEDLIVFEDFDGKSVMEIPLKSGGEFKAFIEVWETRHKREFTDNEIFLCETIASQAAIAIENATLFSKAQEEIEFRKKIEEKLKHDALHDTLTDLPNRELFLDRLERAVLRKKRFKDLDFAVVHIDLDRFKQVNDTFGHAEGDRLLIQAAQIFQECVREVDTVARFGGDEFVLLLEGPMDAIDAKVLTERIQEQLNKPMKFNEHELIITASLGIALSSQGFEIGEDIMRNADIAMYQAKANGKGRCEIFSEAKGLSARRRMGLESELRQAFVNGDYLIYYQPIIDLKTSRIAGFEALLRWQKNDESIVLPGEFISVLEETGLIIDVGYWTLNEVCRQIMSWKKDYPGLAPLKITLNVSGNQITHPKFLVKVREAIETSGIDASSLIFEITENVFIQEMASVTNILKELQSLGVLIYLDDFGTGFSSLGYLTKLPIDAIKIDRLFINRIDPMDEQKGLLQTILSMAREMEFEVVAEGIEREEQVTVLQKNDCTYGQGFFFSKGQSLVETNQYLQDYLKDLGDEGN